MPRVDLHVHTQRYSNCAEFLVPEELGRGMLQAGLDGVVITEHDAQWMPEEIVRLQHLLPQQRLFFGIEITAKDGHVIAIGAPAAVIWHRGETITEIASRVDAVGGCAMWVHPFQEPRRWEEAPTNVHAIEIYSNITTGRRSMLALDLATRIGVPAVAGSDAHSLDHLGTAWVEFDSLPEDELQLAQWIRQGHARPFRRT